MFNVTLQTTKCIRCETMHDLVLGGHVVARIRNKANEMVEIPVLANLCRGCRKRNQPDKRGCYGKFHRDMGLTTYSIYEYDGE